METQVVLPLPLQKIILKYIDIDIIVFYYVRTDFRVDHPTLDTLKWIVEMNVNVDRRHWLCFMGEIYDDGFIQEALWVRKTFNITRDEFLQAQGLLNRFKHTAPKFLAMLQSQTRGEMLKNEAIIP